MAGFTYQQVGVDPERKAAGLAGLLRWVSQTFALRPDLGKPLLPIGAYANAIRLTPDIAVAITTDNVGTKVLVAQLAGRYDTVGFDCVAINVNDLLCVGATPLALVDYIAVAQIEAETLEQIGRGLYEGARQARIAIVGGELAQVRELLQGVRPETAFDLSATAIGVVHPERLIVGADLAPGDVVLGLPSSGLHCNGLTLARRILLSEAPYQVDTVVPELGQTVGEALLSPTRIYVAEALALLDANIAVKAFFHISGDGWLNLLRYQAEGVGLRIEQVPEPPALFRLIQELGPVSPAEMYRTFNMGVGFAIIVPEARAEQAHDLIEAQGTPVWHLGRVVADSERRLVLAPLGLVGRKGSFERER
ncbi:MAG TPA: phosphoribosylformylglycinamidine cyclo-ligase [Dehalococcoidia bacterium]|nr:phosphoribosylformylglycinamidine cyclo-ligase [Dehalococcoidia bacterium]